MHLGRSMAFGRITSNNRSVFLFGSPGNPVAVMATFYHFVRGALLCMMGATSTGASLVLAVSTTPIRKWPGHTEYQRAVAVLNNHGQPEIRLTGQQGSGVLCSMNEANCFVMLAHGQGQVNVGDAVQVLLFGGFVQAAWQRQLLCRQQHRVLSVLCATSGLQVSVH